MKMKITKLLPFVLVALTGCATIVSGTQQSMFVDTPEMTGAQCKLNDSKNGTWYLQSTPGSVTVAKGNGPMNVVCSKAGYEAVSVSVDEDFAGATLGNVILGGGIGVFVDAASGAAQKYPDKVIVWMKPKHFESLHAQKSWEEAKASYEKKIVEEAEAKKKAQQPRNNG
jgi:hypothetical protein